MATPLLQTKLYIPSVRPNMVPRPRLIERLNAGMHRKLTLVSAPAGFGKTTVVAEWVAALRSDLRSDGRGADASPASPSIPPLMPSSPPVMARSCRCTRANMP